MNINKNNIILKIAELDSGSILDVEVESPDWDPESVSIRIDKHMHLLISKESAEELAYEILKAATSIVI
jgi:hypothetical protein